MQQDFCIDLMEVIENWSTDKEENLRIKRFFMPPGLFDGLVNILILELKKSPMRPHICERGSRRALMRQMIDIITTTVTDRQPRDFSEICEIFPVMHLSLPKSNLDKLVDIQKRDVINYKLYLQGYHKWCYHHWRPTDIKRVSIDNFKGNNTGILFWGERGIGKSQMLTYCTAWAAEESWFNVSITNQEEFVDGTFDIFRFKNGLYLQKDLAVKTLKDFGTVNAQMSREFDVDLDVYGGCDITGVHDTEAEPCPRVWDELRKCWTDEWKQMLYEPEIQYY